MALYYNGDCVSSINFTPQMTLAEYYALEIKPKYWIRTDGPESSTISASDIGYDNTSSGLTSTNIQDAIDEIDGRIDNLNADQVSWVQGVTLSQKINGLTAENITYSSGTSVKAKIDSQLTWRYLETVDIPEAQSATNLGSISIPASATELYIEFGQKNGGTQVYGGSSIILIKTNITSHPVFVPAYHDAATPARYFYFFWSSDNSWSTLYYRMITSTNGRVKVYYRE